VFQFIVLSIYTLCILFLFIYSLGQLHLSIVYLKKNKLNNSVKNNIAALTDSLPFITIQLPIYNEKEVIERLLKKISEINYPKHLFEIQLLDDSDDETTEIASRVILELDKSVSIDHIRRKGRTGFKAGALKYGLEFAKGEFIAIFDADFVPDKDFLLKTLKAFENEKIGVVQTRWGHLNRKYSLLTEAQAFGLDAHFTVEQKGRNQENCFISFNGTAGIWRKKCIEDAGGWQSDTLTEDLDLSYRAQLKGWQFVYLEEVISPAELPITIGAYKSQQYRWNKGAAETHLKVWKNVWRAKLNPKIKFHALLQLFKGFGFLASFLLTLTTVPILYFKSINPSVIYLMNALSFTLICVLALTLFYYASLTKLMPSKSNRIRYFLKYFPSFIAISLGNSLHNSVAVIEGYLKIKTPFIRTPKFNILEKENSINTSGNISYITFFEGLLSIYFLAAVILSFVFFDFTFLPFHILLTFGYGYMFFNSFAQKIQWKA